MSPRILMNRWVSRGQAQVVHDGTTRSGYLRRGGMTKSRTVDGGAARLLIVVALGGPSAFEGHPCARRSGRTTAARGGAAIGGAPDPCAGRLRRRSTSSSRLAVDLLAVAGRPDIVPALDPLHDDCDWFRNGGLGIGAAHLGAGFSVVNIHVSLRQRRRWRSQAAFPARALAGVDAHRILAHPEASAIRALVSSPGVSTIARARSASPTLPRPAQSHQFAPLLALAARGDRPAMIFIPNQITKRESRPASVGYLAKTCLGNESPARRRSRFPRSAKQTPEWRGPHQANWVSGDLAKRTQSCIGSRTSREEHRFRDGADADHRLH